MASRVAKPRVMPFGTSYPGFQPGGTSDATYEGASAIFYNILNLRFEIFVIYHSFTALFHHFYYHFHTVTRLSYSAWCLESPRMEPLCHPRPVWPLCRKGSIFIDISVAGLSPPPATKSLALSSSLYTVIGRQIVSPFIFFAECRALLHNMEPPLIITQPIP